MTSRKIIDFPSIPAPPTSESSLSPYGHKMAAEVLVMTTIFKTGRHEGKVATPVTSVSKSKSNSSQSSSDFQLYVTGQKTVTC